MKNLIIAILLGVLVTILVTGCGSQAIKYKNVERPKAEVEEIIENELEIQNPQYDMDVNISVEYN